MHKKCVRCGNEFEASSGYVKYCSGCLEEVKKGKKAKLSEYSFWKKQDRLLAGTEGIDYVDRILHIKEKEYRNDKENTIKKCLNFLQNKK